MKLKKFIAEGQFYKGQNITIIETGEDGCIAKIGANTQMVQLSDGSMKYLANDEIMDRMVSEKKWVSKVDTDYSPPEGTFTKSAEEIATQLHKDSEDLDQAMSRLTFYINRAGDNLSNKRKSVLNKAKDLLRKKFK